MENQNTAGKESKRQTSVDITDKKKMVHVEDTWQKKIYIKKIERDMPKEPNVYDQRIKIQETKVLMQYR